ncbi:MAG: threonine synthase [Peptostreptococcaceae bacterium]|nr:threonine synthase [Peptostreptococcaceae bacterium]
MKNIKLNCTKCGKEFSIKKINFRCDICNEPLELEEVKTGKITKGNTLSQNTLERYSDFFPFLELTKGISLGEGFTALTESPDIANKIGIKELYFKNESQNPTWSFKDRGTVAAVQHAIKLGFKRIGTVSSGNMAPSVAAYGSKSNLETFIFVKEGIPTEKINPIAIYNPNLLKINGNYDDIYLESYKIGEENDIYFMNSDVPFRVEGEKTAAFEICEQLNFNMPDYVVVPTSSGGNTRGIEKGFREFKNCGLIDKIPKIICAQAKGCSPIAEAYEDGREVVNKVENPNTIAHAIENPYPPSGNQILRMLKANGGIAVSVTDEEIIDAQGILAREGIFIQPASAVPLAAVKKLKKQNYLNENDRVVCIVTGSGLKYTAVFEKHKLNTIDCDIEDLSSVIKGIKNDNRK